MAGWKLEKSSDLSNDAVIEAVEKALTTAFETGSRDLSALDAHNPRPKPRCPQTLRVDHLLPIEFKLDIGALERSRPNDPRPRTKPGHLSGP